MLPRMAKARSLLWFTLISTTLAFGTLSSCTINDDSDGEGGEGGESPVGGKSSGGTSGSGGAGSGGMAGAAAAGEGGGGSPSGDAGAGGSAAGAGGAGGMDKVCEAEGGEGGAGGVGGPGGRSCTEYCAEMFSTCADYTEDAFFTSEADCRATCQNFSNEQFCCRVNHVFQASLPQFSLDTECLAAAGDEEAGDCG